MKIEIVTSNSLLACSLSDFFILLKNNKSYYNNYFFFPQDVYGDRIRIFRSVSEKGGGVYKLKNEHGKVVRDTRVKEELSRILGCFNIQLDNPVCGQ